MTYTLTGRKIFVATICLFLVTLFTILFLAGEDKIDIEESYIKTHILQDYEITEPQTESFYREMINNHEEEIFILETDTIIHFSTSSWRNAFGYEESEVNGENFFTFVHPKDLPYFANSMIDLTNKGEEIDDIGPFRVKEKSGKFRLYMAKGIPLKNKKGEIVLIAITLRDVSVPIGGESNIRGVISYIGSVTLATVFKN